MTRGTRLAVLAACVAATVPAAAHGPIEKRLRAAPPGTVVVPGPPLDAAALAPAAPTQDSARPLRDLAREATAVVQGVVAGTDVLDGGALHVHRLRVERVLAGTPGTSVVGVVEIRGASRRPPLLLEGARAIVLLAPAPRLTYLARLLPAEGTHYATVAGHDGVLPAPTAAEAAAIERALDDGRAIGDLRDADAVRAARRRLAFAELAGPSPRLAADALVELRGLVPPDPLSADEAEILGHTLADLRVGRATRVGLVTLAGTERWEGALPALARARIDAPEVLAALLAARARLGAPAGRAELARWAASDDPAIRAAAVRALADLDDPAVVADLGRWATTADDAEVRLAAVEALGATGRAEALPVLAETFATSDRALKQRTAQAMLRIGGPATDDVLVDLALHGDSPETQKYAALLLIASHGRDHPAVERMAAGGPGPEVRALLEHGLELRGHHHHE